MSQAIVSTAKVMRLSDPTYLVSLAPPDLTLLELLETDLDLVDVE